MNLKLKGNVRGVVMCMTKVCVSVSARQAKRKKKKLFKFLLLETTISFIMFVRATISGSIAAGLNMFDGIVFKMQI